MGPTGSPVSPTASAALLPWSEVLAASWDNRAAAPDACLRLFSGAVLSELLLLP